MRLVTVKHGKPGDTLVSLVREWSDGNAERLDISQIGYDPFPVIKSRGSLYREIGLEKVGSMRIIVEPLNPDDIARVPISNIGRRFLGLEAVK